MMKAEDMDAFLKYHEIKYSYNPDVIINESYLECSSGWYKLIAELIEDLIKLGWNKEVAQVKEKFGTLNFYINEGSDEIFDRIVKAQKDSATICEFTGKPGKLRTELSWIKTLSDEEFEKRKNYERN